jgi:mRNA interferase RelE/StbE
MRWKFKYRRQAYGFLKNREVFEKIEMKIMGYVGGKKQDIKRLRGNWQDFLRLRIGKIRVIFRIDPDNQVIEIVKAGFRGKIYK